MGFGHAVDGYLSAEPLRELAQAVLEGHARRVAEHAASETNVCKAMAYVSHTVIAAERGRDVPTTRRTSHGTGHFPNGIGLSASDIEYPVDGFGSFEGKDAGSRDIADVHEVA